MNHGIRATMQPVEWIPVLSLAHQRARKVRMRRCPDVVEEHHRAEVVAEVDGHVVFARIDRQLLGRRGLLELLELAIEPGAGRLVDGLCRGCPPRDRVGHLHQAVAAERCEPRDRAVDVVAVVQRRAQQEPRCWPAT